MLSSSKRKFVVRLQHGSLCDRQKTHSEMNNDSEGKLLTNHFQKSFPTSFCSKRTKISRDLLISTTHTEGKIEGSYQVSDLHLLVSDLRKTKGYMPRHKNAFYSTGTFEFWCQAEAWQSIIINLKLLLSHLQTPFYFLKLSRKYTMWHFRNLYSRAYVTWDRFAAAFGW